MRRVLLLTCVLACGDDGNKNVPGDAIDDDAEVVPVDGAPPPPCNPVTQQGCSANEKCTWLYKDTGSGFFTGATDCAPAGTVQLDAACTFIREPSRNYDDCAPGLYCEFIAQRCRRICDPAAGSGACSGTLSCNIYNGQFVEGQGSNLGPPTAGVCEQNCDPLADNDFDGDATTLSEAGTTCGSASNIGCYGFPSQGTPPATRFSCKPERPYPTRFEHRDALASSLNAYTNSCSQGYIPVLFESTGSTTFICVAMCKPLNCYSGNCGSNDENRLGQAPHRCNDVDRRGTFDTSPAAEHCRFLWSFEIDNFSDPKQFLRSPHSDTLGFCFDHSKYVSNGSSLPACATLADGFGPGTPGVFQAADLGCVDSTRIPMMANGKQRVPDTVFGDVRLPYNRY